MRHAAPLAMISVLLVFWGPAGGAATPDSPSLDVATATRFANLALKCLHTEYPNHISHTLDSDAAALAPHLLTPAFYGCLDWHSDVHGHWLLVRLLRLFPQAPFAAAARAEVARSLTATNIAGELQYLQQPDRASFERPYGLAWLLQLCAELREWQDPQAQQWLTTLQPLESAVALRLASWLPKLHYPIRVGEHDQTAFSFGLIWDWAGVAGDTHMRSAPQGRGAAILYQGPQLPAELRALRRGLSLALPGRGGFYAAGSRPGGVRALAIGVPARNSSRWQRTLAAAGGGD